MTNQQRTERAIKFAQNMHQLNRFLVSDKVTKELYGCTKFVLDQKALRQYYNRYEPNPGWQDWDAFVTEVDSRVESMLSVQ